MTRRLTGFAAALLACLAHAQPAADFAYHLPLSTPVAAPFYRVELPPAVYEGALRADLGDLRVLDAAGAPVPMAFLAPPPAARESAPAVPLPIFPLRVDRERRDLDDLTLEVRRDGTGTTVDLRTRDGTAVTGERLAGYLIDAGELNAPAAALTLDLPADANLSTRVKVEGSDDLATWRTLNASTPVLALAFGGRRLTLDRVDLRAGATRYLRLTTVPGQPMLEIDGARAQFAERPIDAPRASRSVVGVADAANPGDYVFDLQGAFPVDRVTVELPEINTVAPVQLYHRNDAKAPWQFAGAAVLYRLRQQDADVANPPLAVATPPGRYWRVAVDARAGGLGGRPPTLVTHWMPQSLVFAARGGGPFELAYGSAQAKPVALPIATLVPGFDARRTPATMAIAKPGAARTPPALAALRQPVDVRRWALWVALVVATLVLGFMAYALVKQMRGAPPAGAAGSAGSSTGGREETP